MTDAAAAAAGAGAALAAGAAPGAGAIGWQEATVIGRAAQTPSIASFFLAPERPFAFAAGQHVDVRLTAEDGYRAIRSYSIASGPTRENPIEICVERLADGEVSSFFHDVVQTGDTVELRGPLGGHFVWHAGEGGPLLLIGGGSGLVPLMSMVRHRTETGSPAPVALLVSARRWQDVLFRDEVEALDARRDGFALALALTREAPRRSGDFGRRVDAAMIREVIARLPAPPRAVYVCGANGFVNAAADGVLAAGIAPEIVRTERYGGA
jgi:ferredoxin-NADP reductase